MSTNYTGNASGITARQSVVITNPSDTDPLTAASNNVATQTLANILKYAMDHAGLIDTASTWTAIQQFANSVDLRGSGDTTATIVTPVNATSNYKLIGEWGASGSAKMRLYFANGGGMFFTGNAKYDPTTSKWVEDLNSQHWRLWMSGTEVKFEIIPNGWTSPFFESDWGNHPALVTCGGLFLPSGSTQMLPSQVIQAWGTYNINSGSVTTLDEVGISSVAVTSGSSGLSLDVTLVDPMKDTKYCPVVTSRQSSSHGHVFQSVPASTTVFNVVGYTTADAQINFSSTVANINIVVLGRRI